MGHTWTVARREFTTTVRRPSYMLATLGTPLFFILVAAITAIPSVVAVQKELAERRHLAVVDEAGLLKPEIIANPELAKGGEGGVFEELLLTVGGEDRNKPPRVHLYPSRAAAQAELAAGKLKGFYVVPADYLEKGELEYVTSRPRFLWRPGGKGNPLRAWLVEGLLAEKVEAVLRARARRPVAAVHTMVLKPDGRVVRQDPRDFLARVVLPFAFAFILMLSIFIASGYLIQGLVEERSSRVIELLLSSVTPEELVAGKLIGLGGAGLLQLVVWVGFSMAPVLLLGRVAVSPSVAALCLVYYLVGFVFFGSIMAGVGCISGGTHESQHFASLWSVVAVVPMLFSPLILEGPNSVFSRVLSYVPFTCPITMIMRVASGEYAAIDVPLSLAVMVLATLVSLRLSARLFRVGLLFQGQRVTLAQLLGHLRSRS